MEEACYGDGSINAFDVFAYINYLEQHYEVSVSACYNGREANREYGVLRVTCLLRCGVAECDPHLIEYTRPVVGTDVRRVHEILHYMLAEANQDIDGWCLTCVSGTPALAHTIIPL